MTDTLAQLCIKYVELSRGFWRNRSLLWGFNLFSLVVFRAKRFFCRKNHYTGREDAHSFNVIPLPEHKVPLPKQRRVNARSIVCRLLQQMARLVIELSSPNHLAATAARALLNIDSESLQQELTRVYFCFRSKPGQTF